MKIHRVHTIEMYTCFMPFKWPYLATDSSAQTISFFICSSEMRAHGDRWQTTDTPLCVCAFTNSHRSRGQVAAVSRAVTNIDVCACFFYLFSTDTPAIGDDNDNGRWHRLDAIDSNRRRPFKTEGVKRKHLKINTSKLKWKKNSIYETESTNK